MKPSDRYAWILAWIAKSPDNHYVNVLDARFVEHYRQATGAEVEVQIFGAATCKQLGRDLAAMMREGKLERQAAGTGAGGAAEGFPKWVYLYSVPEVKKGA